MLLSQGTAIFADALIDIHHIGSTSVPRLKAKLIGMRPFVRNIEVIDDFKMQMTELGFELI
ncbi:GrpB family protein [Paenibacillus etheri]|nr:GrpB family protein [Paenibacillus etheri]